MSYRECLSLQTRMQCLVPDPNANYRSVIDALYRIVRHEGYMYTVRGINVVMYGAGPAHALYFAMYEKVKHALSKPHRSNHLVHGESGGTSVINIRTVIMICLVYHQSTTSTLNK